MNDPDLSYARTRFGLLIGSVYRQWRRQIDNSFGDMNLSDATRMPLLALYVQTQPMRQKELAEELFLETSSLVRVLEQLRQRKLVEWESDPADRRTKYISLTAEGRTVAAAILKKSLQLEGQILAGVTAEELEITRTTLSRISNQFSVPRR